MQSRLAILPVIAMAEDERWLFMNSSYSIGLPGPFVAEPRLRNSAQRLVRGNDFVGHIAST
jgi:hypothetical protein